MAARRELLKYANDPSRPNNTLPFSGHKYGMGFHDTSTGWVGGDYPNNGYFYFYKTVDGGVTWAQQTLPFPAGYQSAFITITGPTFFSLTEGVLPVRMTIGPDKQDLFLYVTHNGGSTWTPSASFARNGGSVDYITQRDAFSWNGTNFLVTNTTGGSWRTITSNVNFGGSILDYDFVSTTDRLGGGYGSQLPHGSVQDHQRWHAHGRRCIARSQLNRQQTCRSWMCVLNCRIQVVCFPAIRWVFGFGSRIPGRSRQAVSLYASIISISP